MATHRAAVFNKGPAETVQQPKDNSHGTARNHSLYGAVFLAAGLYVFILIYPVISEVLLSFLLIIFVSLALNPIVERLGRKIGVAIVTVVFLAIVAVAIAAFSAPLTSPDSRFFDQLSVYWQRVQQPLAEIDRRVTATADPVKSETSSQGDQKQNSTELGVPKRKADEASLNTDGYPSMVKESLHGLLGSLKAFALNITSLIVIFLTVLIGTIFTLLNPHSIVGAMFALIPERHHAKAVTIFRRITEFVPGWAWATLVAMVVVGTLVFLTMWPLFGLGDAFALGLIAGLLEAVPFIGPLLSCIPALLLAIGEGGLTPLWVVLIYLAIYTLEANVIVPLIMADRLHMHPIAVIFSMFICAIAFGPLGVLLAVPMVGIVRILHDELYRPRFLPNVTNKELDRMARLALENGSRGI